MREPTDEICDSRDELKSIILLILPIVKDNSLLFLIMQSKTHGSFVFDLNGQKMRCQGQGCVHGTNSTVLTYLSESTILPSVHSHYIIGIRSLQIF